MQHIAIDLGKRESQICIRAESGEITEERRIRTRSLVRYLEKQSFGRVIVETGAECFRIADAALAAGHQVRVVPATLVRSLGVGARGVKTDIRDARTLSEASCRIDLPSVHIPSAQSRELKTLCGMREELVESRTKIINSVHGWLRGEICPVRSGTTKTFPERVRSSYSELPSYVERQLRAIDHLNAEIREADKEIEAKAKESAVCRRLMSVPGVGPVTALRFLAVVDDVTRFPTAHALQSYLGLVPGERSSGTRQHRTGITKAGSASLRHTLVQAAWTLRREGRRRPDPMAPWADKIEKRRGKHIATIALARKIAGVLFAMWRDGATYQPARVLPPRTVELVAA